MMMSSITRLLSLTLAAGLSTSALAVELDWGQVAQALGKSGSEMPGGVYRIGLPRTDLKVVLDGVELKPALALGSWLAFRSEEDQAMVMGDLVLTADEVSPVIRKLAGEGIEITALHNHLLRAAPATFYMHVLGRGDPIKLAVALHDALVLSKTPLTAASGAAPSQIELDTALIDRTLGAKGKLNGAVYQVSLKRAGTIADAGMAVPDAMGTAEAINFQPTGDGKAAIAGDFVLTANEVNPVPRILRDNGIEVTALHNHMLNDEPRLFFMHFWASDELAKLAAGLRAALDKIDLARG
jgi:Domain of Unknown Function (DUF1259)